MNQKLQLICCRLPRGAGVLPTLAAAFFQTLAAALPSQRTPSRRPAAFFQTLAAALPSQRTPSQRPAAEPHSSSPDLSPSTPTTYDQCEGGTLALPIWYQGCPAIRSPLPSTPPISRPLNRPWRQHLSRPIRRQRPRWWHHLRACRPASRAPPP
jgi:hypothetical protein